MSKEAQTVLVTGAAGFLGSNLSDKLLAEGHSVIGIDNLSMGQMRNLEDALESDRFEFIEADVTHADCFDSIADREVDCIVHLAAFKIPRYGKAIDTLKINYKGTESALEFARARNCKCVIASTSDVYGRNTELPFNEETTDSVIGTSKSPRWAYAVSKLFDEHLAFAYQDSYGIPVTLLRFFGSYGPKQHLSWWAGPQAVFINAVLDDEPIPVHGDGQQTRSFTYVSDTIRATYAAVVNPAANGELINIGSTDEITILDLAKMIKKLSGTPGELKVDFVPYESFTDKKYQDVMRRVPDTALCQRLLGVKAEVSLEQGLAETIEWQRRARQA